MFDCLDHDLVIAKLNAYGFSLTALRLVHDYLPNRKQRTRVNNSYIDWLEVAFGVRQRSILGPLLFNIFLADLFFTLDDGHFTNFTDDNISYVYDNISHVYDNISYVYDNLSYVYGENLDDASEQTSVYLFQWFEKILQVPSTIKEVNQLKTLETCNLSLLSL